MELSPQKLRQLKKEFEARKKTIAELLREYKISRSYIYKVAQRLKWDRKPKKKKAKRGRPAKYKNEYNVQATALCMLGYTNEQLADFFGVNERTIYDWQKTNAEFSQALLNGREKGSSKVAVSLFQRACGYSHKEEKIFCYEGEIIRAETTKHYPPEVKAIALWLKNKYPELWKDKQEIEGSMAMTVGKITKEDIKDVESLFDEITK